MQDEARFHENIRQQRQLEVSEAEQALNEALREVKDRGAEVDLQTRLVAAYIRVRRAEARLG